MEGTFLNRLVALCGGYLFFFIIAKAAYWYYKKEAIGQGDLKFGAMLGAVLGISNLFLALFLAYLLGAGGALFLLVTKRKTLKDTIPFGPFLVLGGVIALLFGRQLIAGYLRLWL
jgi:prepilin signal peptidase PulO-like enzyme (type II secretory pathway)